MKPRWLLVALTILTMTAPSIGSATDLLDVYERALQSDPTFREAEARLLAAKEQKPLARSLLLPQLDLSYNFRDSNRDGETSFFDFQTGTNPNQLIDTNTTSNSTTLQLQQPLFRWDRIVGLNQADKQVAQAEANYAAAKQALMLRVVNRYFDVLAAQDIVERGEAEKEAIGRQLEQAEKRFEVGLIAITDVKESQAAYDRVIADLVQAKRNLANANEALRELTGTYFENLVAPNEDMPLMPPDPTSQEAWVDWALDQNLTLLAARLGSEIAREEVRIRKSGHYPTIDLVATYNDFDSETGGTNTLQGQVTPADATQDLTTDILSIQFNLPLYRGGGTQAGVREAVYLNRAETERVERIARETERITRDAYLGVETDIARVNALKRAVESSETALRATQAGYDVGTRTTVDVLDARRQLFFSQTDYERSLYNYVINVLLLKEAAGTLTDEDIVQANSWITTRGGTVEEVTTEDG
ncbi:MAG: TolC family outer membrane protein [Gammaproteobacteria bacterium]